LARDLLSALLASKRTEGQAWQMHTLNLPFWAVTSRKSASTPPTAHRASSTHGMAFSTTDKMIQALDGCGAGHWRISLVGDGPGLVMLAADLHFDGVTGLCIDPKPDGSGGTEVPVGDLLLQGTEMSGAMSRA
jgi:hypothetical protein